jgi:uracil-DNA glycosylase family 4
LFPSTKGLEGLAEEARYCKNCGLWRHASQTVYGKGSPRAKIVLVGEQPGEQEDVEGKPFVEPAGKLLYTLLVEAGIDRGQVYVTNAVKHFKWEPRGA